jgi:hypothetical protein
VQAKEEGRTEWPHTRQLQSWLNEKRAAADQTAASRWDIVAIRVVRIVLYASSREGPSMVDRIHDDGIRA